MWFFHSYEAEARLYYNNLNKTVNLVSVTGVLHRNYPQY